MNRDKKIGILNTSGNKYISNNLYMHPLQSLIYIVVIVLMDIFYWTSLLHA